MSLRAKFIYTVGQGEDTKQSAAALQSVFGAEDVKSFDEDGCFTSLSEQDTDTLVFLGHAATTNYDRYTPEKFVERFDKQFKGKNKLAVKHVCLLGCEVGLIGESGKSLAQKIANGLAEKGYKNVCVHAFARSPQQGEDIALYVEITSKVTAHDALMSKHAEEFKRKGQPHAVTERKPGFVRVYELDPQTAQELDTLREAGCDKKRIQEIKDKATVRMENANPAIELRMPQNVFIPKEKPEQRKDRVAQHPLTQLEDAKQAAIKKIRKRVAAEKKPGKGKQHKLETVAKALARSSTEEWVSVLAAYAKLVKPVGSTKNSSYEFLMGIVQKAQPFVQAATKSTAGVVAVDADKENTPNDEERSVSQSEEAPAKSGFMSDIMKKAGSALKAATSAVIGKTSPSSSPKQEDAKKKAEEERFNNLMDKIESYKSEIGTFKKQLISERETLKASVLGMGSFFHMYEIQTKRTKIQAYEELLDLLATKHGEPMKADSTTADLLEQKLVDMRQKASELLTDERVTRSKKTSRTKDLLERINTDEYIKDLAKKIKPSKPTLTERAEKFREKTGQLNKRR